ncbi:histidine phosphatase family protein [Mucilaginibacter hurinus]|uniref:Histidine phosphatase family protein n=1 Tax=Mucilaginibacter hurinus TaxID=2201324 RepID=A0A367GSM9_9SPHI|nr:histidine phosphatase family protein [Mucilaginibacter hurinus]RCH56429.1 histidine phosphatase family protein [Mucilaginibacter hurinus]
MRIIAERLKTQGIIPELLVSSPALRAIATANIFSQHFPIPKPLKNKAVYDASESTLLQIINEFPDNADFVGLVGHNPGLTQILYYLTGSLQDMDTSGVALLQFETDSWGEVSGDTGDLISYESPKTSA